MTKPNLVVMLTTPASGPIDPDALYAALQPWVIGACVTVLLAFVLGYAVRAFSR